MAIEPLILSIALSDNDLTQPLIRGSVAVQGVRLLPTVVHPSEMFWRQLKYSDFDVSEMSLSSLLIAAERGDDRFVALPVYTVRRFFHTGILVRADRGISRPQDLRGRKVGVPEYQQTSALWSRGILQHEFGVHPGEVDWYMERNPHKSHGGATGFVPPPGVRLHQIPESTNIGRMLQAGELDATLLYLGRQNLVDRSTIDLSADPKIVPLFADAQAESRRYFAKTGLYPINHAVVVKRELLARHPWLALNLYNAFAAAKAQVQNVARNALRPYIDAGLMPADAAQALDGDPRPYGFRSARPVLETIAQYVHEQGLAQRRLPVEELFAPSTLDT